MVWKNKKNFWNIFLILLLANGAGFALGKCWLEGPSWAKIKVCDLEDSFDDLVHKGKDHLDELLKPVCAVPYKNYVRSVAASCLTSRGDDMDIGEVKNILVNAGFFLESDFSGVSFRFCSLIDYFASGMTPIPSLVLISADYQNTPARSLVPMIAHEMTHVVQMRDMGFEEFSCFYSQEILDKGSAAFYEKNSLEKEAYETQADVESFLGLWH